MTFWRSFREVVHNRNAGPVSVDCDQCAEPAKVLVFVGYIHLIVNICGSFVQP